MIDTIRSWQNNRMLAYVVPLFAFLLMMPLVGAVQIDNTLLPWYRHSPEQWVYPLQCLICGGLLAFFWKHYTFSPRRGFGFATVMALLGIAVWILPTALFDHWSWETASTPKWLHWLGFQEREADGFDPSFFKDQTLLYGLAIAARLFRMVVIVALVEEIFWRGFLMRYLADLDTDFWKTKFGTFTWLSTGATVVLFMFAHNPADWAAAAIYGSLACWVAIRTKSLAACVWMHALANLVLGIYVLQSGNFGLW